MADIAAFTFTAAAQTIASTTLADADNMAFAVSNGTYYAFEFHLLYQSTAIGTGFKVAVTGPNNTVLCYSATTIIAADGTAASAEGHGFQSGDAITFASVDAANTDYSCLIRGVILPTADGTLQLQIASETGTQVQLSAGSIGLLYTPTAKLTSDQNSTSTTPADVTGLALAVQANAFYRFRFYVPFQSTDLTVGAGFDVTSPASNFIQYRGEFRGPNNDGTVGMFQGHGNSSGDQIVATGVPVINENSLAVIDGIVNPTADGNLQLQLKSETGTQVTAKQGAVGWLDLIDEMPILPGARRHIFL